MTRRTGVVRRTARARATGGARRGRAGGAVAGLLGLALALALTGCGDAGEDIPETATGSLADIAAVAGCTPDVQTDAEELKQADCETQDGRYVLAVFRTDRGQREWLDAADDYGGTYLVGRKWVAVGTGPVLEGLRGRLGGTVVKSSHHSGNSGGGGSEEGHHSGHRAS